MSLQRLQTLSRHILSRGQSNTLLPSVCAASHGGNDYVPQYTNAEHPVLRYRRKISLLDSYLSYIDTEIGDEVVVFIHGNPSSSYLWRNVILEVKGTARCLAIDLVGHGQSGKEPNHNYTFENQVRYFNAWIEALNLPNKFVIVGHDWGNAVGFQWASTHQERIKALIYMECAIAVAPSWESFHSVQREVYRQMRSEEGAKEFMNAPENFMLERIHIQRSLNEEEQAMWRAPMEEPGEDRRPIVTWCREVPIKGDGPNDVIEKFQAFRKWASQSKDIPKLYIDIEPGMLSPNNRRVTRNWPNQKVAKAKGFHFCQEDDPVTIGNHIANFLKQDIYK